ncbi:c-type cytochrome domain-containing protein [Bryobacter aggregatus]|uniref:WD40 domain-containing protein n=1 Tax=Bryobacter aggregatus TaxID=360054 RepID=UPI000689D898|nr:c-type cytochrome domain-containing protein [Bryobacter aggregatus]
MPRSTGWLFLLSTATMAAAPSYYRDVRPLLQKNCAGCHQPSAKASGLDLTSYAAFAAGGKKGPAFAAGKADESLTIQYLTGAAQPRMPLGVAPLSPADVQVFRDWIQAGAKDDTPASVDDNRPSVYLQPPVITSLRFSPDGKQIAVSGNREVLLHRVSGEGAPIRLHGKAERILSLAFSSDGKLLIAGGGTPAQFGEVQIWDAPNGKLLRTAVLTNDTVFGASLAPDASKIAVGAADNTVHVFETATAKELYKIGNHEDWVLSTVFGVDSKRFVSVSRDRAAKIIDANSGAFLENANLLKSELYAIARHPKKDIVVFGGEDRYPYVYLLDRPRNMKIADDTTLVRRIERQDGPITALDWSGDGKLIAVAGQSPKVNLYDADTGDHKLSCTGHTAGIYALSFSSDGTRLATGGFDGKVRIYSTADCSLVREFVPVPITATLTAGAK